MFEFSFYLIGPIGLAIALLFFSKFKLNGRALFRRIATGVAGLWILGTGLVIRLSEYHVSLFEEMMLSVLLLILIVVIDHKMNPD